MMKIEKPSIIAAAGTPPKTIAEFIGRVNSGTADVSIAKMSSPPGWREPFQQPDFDEYTLVLNGSLSVEMKDSMQTVNAGQAIIIPKGTRVRYSTPNGAEYIAVCLPAFSPDLVHREEK